MIAGVDDEIVDGGLRIPQGRRRARQQRRMEHGRGGREPGMGNGGRRFGGVASGDYGWP